MDFQDIWLGALRVETLELGSKRLEFALRAARNRPLDVAGKRCGDVLCAKFSRVTCCAQQDEVVRASFRHDEIGAAIQVLVQPCHNIQDSRKN